MCEDFPCCGHADGNECRGGSPVLTMEEISEWDPYGDYDGDYDGDDDDDDGEGPDVDFDQEYEDPGDWFE